jgi:hypothetical protein
MTSNYSLDFSKVYTKDELRRLHQGLFLLFEKGEAMAIIDAYPLSHTLLLSEGIKFVHWKDGSIKPVVTRLSSSPLPQSRPIVYNNIRLSICELLTEIEKPAEGRITYSKAVQIAFDVNTPDTIAKQFSAILSDAKELADNAAQPVTLFAQFSVKPNGDLTFNCPIEYKPNAKQFELQAILRDKFNVTHFQNSRVGQLAKDQLREALKQVRAGNTDLFKFKN